MKALLKVQTETTFLPRKLLVSTIGREAAEHIMPQLPELIAMNVEQVLSFVPDDLIQQAESPQPTPENQDGNSTP